MMKLMYAIVPITAAMLGGPFARADGGHHALRVIVHDEPLVLAQAAKVGTAHEHMEMMRRKMDKYHASRDQNERAKIRTELYADMRDHMKLMRGRGGDFSKRQEMMEMRMDQMHQMMDWMLTFDSDFRPLGP